jgi:hypothetical protein
LREPIRNPVDQLLDAMRWTGWAARLGDTLSQLGDHVHDSVSEGGGSDQNAEDQHDGHGQLLVVPTPCLRPSTQPHDDDDSEQ